MSRGQHVRLVVDSNVFVAACFSPQSASARIVQRAREGIWQVVWNEATRAETRAVLSQIPPLQWSDVAAVFHERNEYVGETHP